MKHKKLTAGLLAGAMAFSMAIPALAATGTTDISLSFSEDYVMTVPATTTVTSSGWTALENGLNVECTTHNFREGRLVFVTATSANDWALSCPDVGSVGYTLYAEDNNVFKELYFYADDVNAEGGTTNAVYVDVEDFSAADVGTYTDTITWTGAVAQKAVSPGSLTE